MDVFCENCGVRLCNLFSYLSKKELKMLSESKNCRRYRKGEIVFFEGDLPYGIYCVHSGKAKIYKIGNSGKEQIIRLAGSGDFMGFKAMLNEQPYHATAEVLEESAICFIPKETFFHLLQTNVNFSVHMMKFLCQELENAEKYMLDLAQKTVRERVASVLLLLDHKYGTNSDNQTLDVQLTREDLANIVGTATETLIRLLTEFKKEHLIELNGRHIKLINKRKLHQIAKIPA